MRDFTDKKNITPPPTDESLKVNFLEADNINTIKNEMSNLIQIMSSLTNNDNDLVKCFLTYFLTYYDIKDVRIENITTTNFEIFVDLENTFANSTYDDDVITGIPLYGPYKKDTPSSGFSGLTTLANDILDNKSWYLYINFLTKANDRIRSTTRIVIPSNDIYKKCLLVSLLKNYQKHGDKIKRFITETINNTVMQSYYINDVLHLGKIEYTTFDEILPSTIINSNRLYLSGNVTDSVLVDMREHPLTWYYLRDKNFPYILPSNDEKIIKIKSFNNKYLRNVDINQQAGSEQNPQVGYHSHRTENSTVTATPSGNPSVLKWVSPAGNELSSATGGWGGTNLTIPVNIPELPVSKQYNKDETNPIDINQVNEVNSVNLLAYMNVD